jgi:hypothetical protein
MHRHPAPARFLLRDGWFRDPAAVLDDVAQSTDQRLRRVFEQDVLVIGRIDQLRNPAGARRQERDARTERFVNSARRVIERRRHDRELAAAAQILQRLRLSEVGDRLDRKLPRRRAMRDVVETGYSSATLRLPEEGDADSALRDLVAQDVQRIAEKAQTFALLEPPEENDLRWWWCGTGTCGTDTCGTDTLVGARQHVLLHECLRRQLEIARRHPVEQIAAGTPEQIGAGHADLFGAVICRKEDAGGKRLVQLEHPSRGTVKSDDQKRIAEGQAESLRGEREASLAATVVEVDDVERTIGQESIDEPRQAEAAVLQRPGQRLHVLD